VLPRRAAAATDPRRILLVKFWGLGNLVLLLPVFRALRTRYPAAEIRLLTLARNEELLEGVGDIDGTLLVPEGRLGGIAFGFLARLREARAWGPDLVVDFEQFSRASAVFAFLCGAPLAVGLDAARRGGLYHVRVPLDPTRHASRTFLALARAAGAAAEGAPPLPPPVLPADRARAAALLEAAGAGNGPILVLHPGSGDNFLGRRWAAENFAHLADRLLDRFGGVAVVTGTGAEAGVVARVRESSSRPDRMHAVAGLLRVRELAALCERADLVVSNDTAPVHLASALGRPVLALYGPNTPVLYGPLSRGSVAFWHRTPCSPCLTHDNHRSSLCRMPVCIRSVGVEEVAEAAERILERRGRGGEALPEARVSTRAVPGPGGEG
jgi:heptosyltransferase-3